MSDKRNWVVWSNDHGAWWGPHHSGYTGSLLLAGLYTKMEAQEIERQGYTPSVGKEEEAYSFVDALELHGGTEPQSPIALMLVREALADSKQLSQIEAWGLAYNTGSAWQDDLVKLDRLNDPANEDDEDFVPEYEWSVHGPAHPGYPSGGVTIIGEGPTLRKAITNAEQKEVVARGQRPGVA